MRGGGLWEASIDTIGAAPDFDRVRISGEIMGAAHDSVTTNVELPKMAEDFSSLPKMRTS
jgi:hypothetical protein